MDEYETIKKSSCQKKNSDFGLRGEGEEQKQLNYCMSYLQSLAQEKVKYFRFAVISLYYLENLLNDNKSILHELYETMKPYRKCLFFLFLFSFRKKNAGAAT
jgi:hypothetical protein